VSENVLVSPRMLVSRLSADLCIDAYLLMEDEELIAMVKRGSSYEELKDYADNAY
jgi:hypothetical protein